MEDPESLLQSRDNDRDSHLVSWSAIQVQVLSLQPLFLKPWSQNFLVPHVCPVDPDP